MYIFDYIFQKEHIKGLISKKGHINRELWGREGEGGGGRGREGGSSTLCSGEPNYVTRHQMIAPAFVIKTALKAIRNSLR